MTTATKDASRARKGEKTKAKSDKKGKSGRKKGKKSGRTAATSDRHELYELSVQEPDSECDLIEQVWREQRQRPCRTIREDFCGTAVVCRTWVKRNMANRAYGVDLDGEVLGWGRGRMESQLNDEQKSRVTLREGNVLDDQPEKVDSVLAMNFSYYIFETRDELRAYFRKAYEGLVDDGMFLLDAYGGAEAFLEIEEDRDCEGFTYIWDQNFYNPITGVAVNYIHFEFPDGTRMDKAFRYQWRLWTLPEIREVLVEAGFSKVAVYWEGEDEDGEGNGEWSVAERGDACDGWIAYLVAMK